MTDEKFHQYLLEKLSNIDNHLIDIKVEVATLKGKAIVWGAISGILATVAISYLFKIL